MQRLEEGWEEEEEEEEEGESDGEGPALEGYPLCEYPFGGFVRETEIRVEPLGSEEEQY